MSDRLEIPDAAFHVKADYFERPSRELVGLIKQFIQQFGTPHLWWGHTHTKPTKGARVTFLSKYTLPKSHHAPDRWAPCPCCSPWHPKYFRHGLIAWFPEEGVIRCVGDKCYKKMDPEGYELAMEQLNAETAAEQRANFLLTRIPRIPEYIQVLESNLPAIEAIDLMLNRFRYVLGTTFNIDLWSEANTGILRYTVIRREMRRGRDGNEEIHQFPDFENYGSIAGHHAVRPGHSKLAKKLKDRIDNLQVINFGLDPLERIAAMTETDKKRAVKVLSYGHNNACEICQEAEDIRRFFTQVTISTINGWAEQDGTPNIHLALNNEGILIARYKDQDHTAVRWPPNFWNSIRQLEPLSRTNVA